MATAKKTTKKAAVKKLTLKQQLDRLDGEIISKKVATASVTGHLRGKKKELTAFLKKLDKIEGNWVTCTEVCKMVK